MSLAYTFAPGKGDTDLVLAQAARRLSDLGLRLSGVVQINTDCPKGGPCDMDVQVLPHGPVLRISQSLGRQARGCRLDPDALERAIALCDAQLGAADVLIVNKFGKHEALGRGFRPLIASAMVRDVPVLVGLNGLNQEAFHLFTEDTAHRISPDVEAITTWVLDNVTEPRVSACAS